MSRLVSAVSLALVPLVVLSEAIDAGHGASGVVAAPQAQVFSAGPDFGARRAFHTATLLTDGRLLVVGGFSGNVTFASALLVDPVSRAVRATGSLQTPRGRHTATLLKDGRVLIVGGYVASGGTTAPLDSAEIYDPVSERFVPTGSMASARDRHAAAMLPDGRVLICGGLGAVLDNRVTPVHSTAEVFDAATGRFTAAGNMTATRSGHSATLLETGQVLVTSSGTAELYDSTSNRFTRVADPIASRTGHTATPLKDGQVLLAGGISSNLSLATAERYDSRAAVFRATGSLATPRTAHTATLLDDGRVLVAGGQTVTSTPSVDGRSPYTVTTTATAEMYDPTAGTFSAAGSLAVARGGHAAASTANGVWIIAGIGGMGLNSSEVFAAATPSNPRPEARPAAERRADPPPRVGVPPPADAPREERLYASKDHGWSISYPQDWSLDDRDPEYVKIKSSGAPAGFVGIHFALFDRDRVSLDAFAETLMIGESRRAGFRILSRKPLTLPDGTPALEVVNVLGVKPAGQSRKVFVIVANRGFSVNAETYVDAWPSFDAVFDRMIVSFRVAPPPWQSRLEDARRLASDSAEYSLTTPSGVFVFQNNPRPFCYMYSIPGDWVAAPEPSAYRSQDGKAFVGVQWPRRQDLQAYPGRTPAERALTGITRRYEEGLGQKLNVQIVPFDSSRPGAWKWTAAPIALRDRDIVLTTKFVVDLDRNAVAEITITGTSDDDGLARRIIEALKTTSDRQCYWSTLESLLKTGK